MLRYCVTLRHRAQRANLLPQQVTGRRIREHRRLQNNRAQRFLNMARINNHNVLPNTHSFGEFDKVCNYCGALKFENEELFKCCHNGKVQLDNL